MKKKCMYEVKNEVCIKGRRIEVNNRKGKLCKIVKYLRREKAVQSTGLFCLGSDERTVFK